jgi:hypothetical protein
MAVPTVTTASVFMPPTAPPPSMPSRHALWLFFDATAPQLARVLLMHEVSRSHTQRITVGRTPPDEWSARRRDRYLTTHNNHNRQTSMPTVGFEPIISAHLRLRPRGHWDRPLTTLLYFYWGVRGINLRCKLLNLFMIHEKVLSVTETKFRRMVWKLVDNWTVSAGYSLQHGLRYNPALTWGSNGKHEKVSTDHRSWYG